jgi:hypothetical protein
MEVLAKDTGADERRHLRSGATRRIVEWPLEDDRPFPGDGVP